MKKPMKTDHYGQVMKNPDGSTLQEDVITGLAKEPPPKEIIAAAWKFLPNA